MSLKLFENKKQACFIIEKGIIAIGTLNLATKCIRKKLRES